MTVAINILLWLVVGVLAFIAAMRGRGLLIASCAVGYLLESKPYEIDQCSSQHIIFG